MSDPILERAIKQGPCGFCGRGLARHRLWDSLDGKIREGASYAEIYSEWPDVSRAEVDWVFERYARARRQHRPLPGREGWRP